MTSENDKLIQVHLMRLTVRPGDPFAPSVNMHPKAIRRMKELRLSQPLPASLLPELELFTGLRQIYLDAGTDSLATLKKLPKHLKCKLPVMLVLGLDVNVPRPLYKEHPEFVNGHFMIDSPDRQLDLKKVEAVELDVGAAKGPVDVGSWINLKRLDIELTPGAPLKDVVVPADAGNATIRCYDFFFLTVGHSAKPWSLKLGVNWKLKRTLHASGDLSGFRGMLLQSPVRFESVFPSLRSLTIQCTLDENQFQDMIAYLPGVTDIQIRYPNNFALTENLKTCANLKGVFLLLDGDRKHETEEIARALKQQGIRVEASFHAGSFLTEQFDSETFTWQTFSER